MGNVFTKLIERNTTIPTKKSEVFTTAENNQTSVEIHVLQGERPMAIDNKTIGRFHLTGIPPAPRGMPQIEVGFDIDANGILNVSARDKATGKQQSIRIEASSGLGEAEIKKMVKDADLHSEEDKKKREQADTKNRADQMVYETEKGLRDYGDKLDPDAKAKVEAAVGRVKEALKTNNLDEIKSATEALTSVWHEAAGEMYQQTQQAQGTTSQSGPQEGRSAEGRSASGGKTGEGEPVDADYEVVS